MSEGTVKLSDTHNWTQIDGSWFCSWCGAFSGTPESMAACAKYPTGPRDLTIIDKPPADAVVDLFTALKAALSQPKRTPKPAAKRAKKRGGRG